MFWAFGTLISIKFLFYKNICNFNYTAYISKYVTFTERHQMYKHAVNVKQLPQSSAVHYQKSSQSSLPSLHSLAHIVSYENNRCIFLHCSSCEFNLLQILSELLTIQEHFGTLNDMTFAWVGAACPQLNTYLTIAPPLGIKIRFLCQCGGPVSPSHLNHVESLGSEYTGKINECEKLEEVIKGANVIATSEHPEENLTIKLSDLEKHAAKNWVFLHSLPRTTVEVEDKVFDSERNILWKSFVNSKWICAAIILKFLGEEQKLVVEKDSNNYCS